MISNILSVDLESFIHREFNPEKRVFQDNNYTYKANMYLLDLFEKYDITVTFFVLGEIYEWYPDLIEEIKKRGHEIAWHGHSHVPIKSKEFLEEELKKSQKFLWKYKPQGFRAPRMFLQRDYLGFLKEYGFTYDSSVYAQSQKDTIFDGITEIPVSIANFPFTHTSIRFPQPISKRLLLQGIPFGSGLSLAIFQKHTQFFINALNRKNLPAVLFFHPWQVLEYPDSMPKTLKNLPRFIYKRDITNTLEYLLAKNTFVSFREFLNV